MTTETPFSTLMRHLTELRLPAVRQRFQEFARRAEQEGLAYEHYLMALISEEIQTRRHHRIERLLAESRLPLEKSFETFDRQRIPPKVARQVSTLSTGQFLDNRENILVFGNPGSGKTHLVCALSQALIRQGRRLLFCSANILVQQLLVAKRDLDLARTLKRLGSYDGIVIDDIGYIQQNREEMEVLFTLLADRYERSSILLTSNLPFSKWEQIFKDPMTTAAAIDRLVHHSVILELNVESYRISAAKKQRTQEAETVAADSLPVTP
jgi:DNA replication protein DnaC